MIYEVIFIKTIDPRILEFQIWPRLVGHLTIKPPFQIYLLGIQQHLTIKPLWFNDLIKHFTKYHGIENHLSMEVYRYTQ